MQYVVLISITMKAIVITWDGGGSQTYWDTHTGYQEIKCILYKDGEVTISLDE